MVDEVMGVPDDEAIRAGRELASTEGLLAGISSGAAVYAARQLSLRPEFKNKKIVALRLCKLCVICSSIRQRNFRRGKSA